MKEERLLYKTSYMVKEDTEYQKLPKAEASSGWDERQVRSSVVRRQTRLVYRFFLRSVVLPWCLVLDTQPQKVAGYPCVGIRERDTDVSSVVVVGVGFFVSLRIRFLVESIASP